MIETNRPDKTPSFVPNFTPEELTGFLSDKRILVADTATYVTQSLHRMLNQLGARTTQIHIYRSFSTAAQGILARKPHILITGLHIDGQSGLDLVRLQEKQFENRLEVASLVLVNSASGPTAALLAEAGVDAALMKPLNFQSAMDAIHQALANKVKPSPYWRTIELAKERLNRTELEEAMRLFEEAKNYDPKPTLPFYYQGLIEWQKERLDRALALFDNGLTFDPNDYRCLNATFDIHMKRSEHRAAYSVMRKIRENYPINVDKLLDLVQLSISVGKFEDIPDYHRIFLEAERPDPKMIRGIVAALLVSAKSFHWKGEKDKALEALRSSARLSMKNRILREDVLRYHVETENYGQALAFFKDLPASLKEDPDNQLLALEAHHGSGNSSEAVRLGTQMLKTGRGAARTYEIVIDHSIRLSRPETVISRLIFEAQEMHPTLNWR